MGKIKPKSLYDGYWKLPIEERKKLPHAGFAEPYGRCDIWEDRATVAALLMTAPDKIDDRMKDDSVLGKKVKKLLLTTLDGQMEKWMRNTGKR